MSDYFLNKIYDALLANKTPKTNPTFKTLSECYKLVYVQEADQPTITPTTSLSAEPVTSKQPDVQNTTPKFDIQQTRPSEVKWTPEQESLYNKRLTGTGPGEFSVAALITGKTNIDELAEHVSGGTLSYDVEVDNLKFEVKQLQEGKSDDVRIGVEGQAVGIKITTTISQMLKNILEEYNSLPEEEKNKVNQQIVQSVSSIPEIAAPSAELKGRERTNYRERAKTNKKHRELFETKRTGWNLAKYIEGIEGNITELSLKLLFEDQYREFAVLETTKAKKPVDGLRRQYVIMSVKELLEVINKLAEQPQEEQTSAISSNSNSVQAFKKVFKDFYGTAKNKQEELETILDREAEVIDKRLSKLKCKTTGEGCYSVTEFYNDLKQQNFLSTLMNLKQYLETPSTVSNIFPEDLTGIFAVNPNGYCYLPRTEAGKYMRITRISSGGKPKIAFKPESLRMSVQIPSPEAQTQNEL